MKKLVAYAWAFTTLYCGLVFLVIAILEENGFYGIASIILYLVGVLWLVLLIEDR